MTFCSLIISFVGGLFGNDDDVATRIHFILVTLTWRRLFVVQMTNVRRGLAWCYMIFAPFALSVRVVTFLNIRRDVTTCCYCVDGRDVMTIVIDVQYFSVQWAGNPNQQWCRLVVLVNSWQYLRWAFAHTARTAPPPSSVVFRDVLLLWNLMTVDDVGNEIVKFCCLNRRYWHCSCCIVVVTQLLFCLWCLRASPGDGVFGVSVPCWRPVGIPFFSYWWPGNIIVLSITNVILVVILTTGWLCWRNWWYCYWYSLLLLYYFGNVVAGGHIVGDLGY